MEMIKQIFATVTVFLPLIVGMTMIVGAIAYVVVKDVIDNKKEKTVVNAFHEGKNRNLHQQR